MKTILNVSRLHQQELWSVIKMCPDDPLDRYIISGYKIINPDDPPTGDPPTIQPRDVTKAQYDDEVIAYQQNHQNDLSAPGIQILETYTKENVLTPEIVDNLQIVDASTVPEIISVTDYDLIFIGISDGGVDIFKKGGGVVDPVTQESSREYSQLQALVNARDIGIPIIFTHDVLEVVSFCNPFPDDYESLVGNFGVDSYAFDYGAEGSTINHIKCINPTHPIMTSYYELPHILEVQPTHNNGLVLNSSVSIIYEEALRTSGNANYYLAAYEQEGKGKVVFCSMGHCFGNWNQFFRPGIEECKILVNAIIWALQ